MTNNATLSATDLARLSDLMTALEQAKKDKNEQRVILDKIMDFFRANNIKTYHYNDIVIRFTDARQTNQFDVDMLQSKYPEIWEECHSVVTRPPHLQVKKLAKADDSDDVPSDEELLEAMSEASES